MASECYGSSSFRFNFDKSGMTLERSYFRERFEAIEVQLFARSQFSGTTCARLKGSSPSRGRSGLSLRSLLGLGGVNKN